MPVTPHKFLHDKVVLLLMSTNVFLAFLTIVVLLLRVGVGQGSSGYIVQYRANLGISAFKSGDFTDIASFGLFALLTLAINIFLSLRVYHLRRTLSLALLGLGVLLLSITLIVTNSLLSLR